MAQNRRKVSYIKLPYATDGQKVKVTRVGKMAVICTQKCEKIEEAEILPKTVTKHKGENF